NFGALTITGQLEVIEQAAAGASGVSVIGSSLGGYLAALYAARHPEVEWLLLLAPAFGFARRWRERLGEEGVEEWRRSGYMEVFHYASQRPQRLGYGFLEDAQGYEELPEFSQPALILHGLRDDVVPPEQSCQVARNRPNVELRMLESDHGLTDGIDEIWAAARGFFSGGRPAPPANPGFDVTKASSGP
ncbi:MAG: prolyl oligopeptidase family serine peptidase, partial [bacterium]|nr:prolyl oligopeptidase family serine peptidase [bacterium]